MRSLRPSFRALSSLILQSFFSGSHFPPAFLTASRTLISHGRTSTRTSRKGRGFHGASATTSSTVVRRLWPASSYR